MCPNQTPGHLGKHFDFAFVFLTITLFTVCQVEITGFHEYFILPTTTQNSQGRKDLL